MDFMEELWDKIKNELETNWHKATIENKAKTWEEETDIWYGPKHFPREPWCPPGVSRRTGKKCSNGFCGPVVGTDQNLFKCLVYGLFTNSVDATVFFRVIHSGILPGLFFNFDPAKFHAAGISHIATITSALRQLRAGFMNMRRSLENLQTTAGILASMSNQYGSINTYLFSIVKGVRHPICLACALGSAGSSYHLPGFGIPLAAESLKNMGCQLSKPDRHILRALGCFGLAEFRNWRSRAGVEAPTASEKELRKAMWTMEAWALTVGVSPLRLDYAIWLLCARSGLHASNQDLENMAQSCTAKVSPKFVTRCVPCEYCR